jgi:ketosteroid isomerase-like protein
MVMSVRSLLEVFGRGLLCLSLGALTQLSCGQAETARGQLKEARAESNPQNAEAEVREFLRVLGENEVRRDRAVAERTLADDFVRTGPRGEVWDRAQTLANFPADDGTAARSVQFEDERIRVYGETAVVTGLGVLKATNKQGRPVEIRNRCTFVLVRRDGRWQAVAAHQTRAE